MILDDLDASVLHVLGDTGPVSGESFGPGGVPLRILAQVHGFEEERLPLDPVIKPQKHRGRGGAVRERGQGDATIFHARKERGALLRGGGRDDVPLRVNDLKRHRSNISRKALLGAGSERPEVCREEVQGAAP